MSNAFELLGDGDAGVEELSKRIASAGVTKPAAPAAPKPAAPKTGAGAAVADRLAGGGGRGRGGGGGGGRGEDLAAPARGDGPRSGRGRGGRGGRGRGETRRREFDRRDASGRG